MAERHGGRQKGTPNKKTVHLRIRARELGVDPFEIVLLYAKGDYKTLGYKKGEISPALRAQMAAEALEYLESKRKAVEHSIDDGTSQTLTDMIKSLASGTD